MEQYMPIVWVGFAIFMLLCEGFTTQLVSIWFVLGSVGAETWTVKSDKAPLLKGTKVKVLAIEGVKLIVEPISE